MATRIDLIKRHIETKAQEYSRDTAYSMATQLGIAQSLLDLTYSRIAVLHGKKAADEIMKSIGIDC